MAGGEGDSKKERSGREGDGEERETLHAAAEENFFFHTRDFLSTIDGTIT